MYRSMHRLAFLTPPSRVSLIGTPATVPLTASLMSHQFPSPCVRMASSSRRSSSAVHTVRVSVTAVSGRSVLASVVGAAGLGFSSSRRLRMSLADSTALVTGKRGKRVLSATRYPWLGACTILTASTTDPSAPFVSFLIFSGFLPDVGDAAPPTSSPRLRRFGVALSGDDRAPSATTGPSSSGMVVAKQSRHRSNSGQMAHRMRGIWEMSRRQ
mmetsp:Transcript_54947/g.64261  ORF Transcript_54947/g.64261 Transcript_54947/m.64261 type:complete len:213 (+) Transcript_54947:589-1227(+)